MVTNNSSLIVKLSQIKGTRIYSLESSRAFRLNNPEGKPIVFKTLRNGGAREEPIFIFSAITAGKHQIPPVH